MERLLLEFVFGFKFFKPVQFLVPLSEIHHHNLEQREIALESSQQDPGLIESPVLN